MQQMRGGGKSNAGQEREIIAGLQQSEVFKDRLLSFVSLRNRRVVGNLRA
jgi:hypothetical protein